MQQAARPSSSCYCLQRPGAALPRWSYLQESFQTLKNIKHERSTPPLQTLDTCVTSIDRYRIAATIV